jgi:hypothetical protein
MAAIDLTPVVVDVVGYAGDDTAWTMTATWADTGDPVDVSGTSLATVKATRSDPAPLAVIAVTPVVETPGMVQMLVDGDTMGGLPPALRRAAVGEFVGVWDWQVEIPGAGTRTLAQGSFTVREDVSREVGP